MPKLLLRKWMNELHKQRNCPLGRKLWMYEGKCTKGMPVSSDLAEVVSCHQLQICIGTWFVGKPGKTTRAVIWTASRLGVRSFVCPILLAIVCLVLMTELEWSPFVKWLETFSFNMLKSTHMSSLCLCCSLVRSTSYLRLTCVRCGACLRKACLLLIEANDRHIGRTGGWPTSTWRTVKWERQNLAWNWLTEHLSPQSCYLAEVYLQALADNCFDCCCVSTVQWLKWWCHAGSMGCLQAEQAVCLPSYHSTLPSSTLSPTCWSMTLTQTDLKL